MFLHQRRLETVLQRQIVIHMSVQHKYRTRLIVNEQTGLGLVGNARRRHGFQLNVVERLDTRSTYWIRSPAADFRGKFS
jgi:hypothetical protein